MIQKAGPKTDEQRRDLMLKVESFIINGDVHQMSYSECANILGISRNTFKGYLNKAYKNLEFDVEAENKRIKDTRNYVLKSLLDNFTSTTNPLIKEKLGKSIVSILDSQEKSNLLIQENKKQYVNTNSKTLREVFLDKLPKTRVKVIDVPVSD